jgi:hypothetical protein
MPNLASGAGSDRQRCGCSRLHRRGARLGRRELLPPRRRRQKCVGIFRWPRMVASGDRCLENRAGDRRRPAQSRPSRPIVEARTARMLARILVLVAQLQKKRDDLARSKSGSVETAVTEGLNDVVNPVKRVLPTSATPTATPSMRRRAEADGS